MANADGLAINLATIRQQYDLRGAAEACARHGIGGVAPWRDQIAATGLDEAARILKDNGLKVTGLPCRGGMFTVDPNAIDDNKRAIDEAVALGAQCLVLVVGGLPKGSRDLRRGPASASPTVSRRCFRMPARRTCRSLSSRCTRCMRRTAQL